MALPSGYAKATAHPWACLLFVLPMLVAYEAGVLCLGGHHPETIRNGADHWLRCALLVVGVKLFWAPPLLLSLVFIVWTWQRRGDRPGDLIGVLSGMVLESITFALGLWAISRVLAPLLLQAGIELSTPPEADDEPPAEAPAAVSAAEPALRQLVTYLGAGIYEEAIFRLALFSSLAAVLRALDLWRGLAVGFAAVGSAVLFSAAHHIGPYGQTYSNYLFLFRLAAGLYFALVYQFRGFGIAVGAHACYNLMVSIA
jgi:membrane protease YdiL (CAAX protease family)